LPSGPPPVKARGRRVLVRTRSAWLIEPAVER
jgi:hypothetical protein